MKRIDKKIYVAAARAAALIFTIFVVAYAWFLNGVTSYALSKDFYFLVANTTHVEASAHVATLQGGAGYLVQDKERSYSALAVYLTRSAGETAKAGLLETDEYSLLVKRVDKLYFKTRKQKRNSARILAAFSCLEDCIEVLNGEIARLENNAPQRSSKAVLQDLADQFSHLAKTYEGSFPSYATVCKGAATALRECCTGIVYARELRYVCCGLCDSFVSLGEEFSL